MGCEVDEPNVREGQLNSLWEREHLSVKREREREKKHGMVV